MNFPDTCVIKTVTGHNDYGRAETAEVESVCAYEQTTGITHTGYQDQVSGSPVLYLPPDSRFYELQGAQVVVNAYSQLTFKVVSCSPIRDTLLHNQVRHIECELQKIDVSQGVS